jgi:hypothetical protein
MENRHNRPSPRFSAKERNFAETIAGRKAADGLRPSLAFDSDFGVPARKDQHELQAAHFDRNKVPLISGTGH